MKAYQRIVIVEKKVWSCGHPHHNHTTEVIAQNCIDRRTNIWPRPKVGYRARNLHIAMRVAQGEYMTSIARDHSISGSRVSGIFHKMLRMWRGLAIIDLVEKIDPVFDQYRPPAVFVRDHQREYQQAMQDLTDYFVGGGPDR